MTAGTKPAAAAWRTRVAARHRPLALRGRFSSETVRAVAQTTSSSSSAMKQTQLGLTVPGAHGHRQPVRPCCCREGVPDDADVRYVVPAGSASLSESRVPPAGGRGLASQNRDTPIRRAHI